MVDVKEWLTSADIQKRIKLFAYYASSPKRGGKEYCYGRRKGFIFDAEKRIALILEDFDNPFCLKAGDFVHYRTPHPEMPQSELRIDGSATIRTDHGPKIPVPEDVMPANLDC
jgi:hypothetical protein